MTKQYRYIGKDPQKKGWVAKHEHYYYKVFGERLQLICSQEVSFIENEPDTWEEMKEDIFDKVFKTFENRCNGGGTAKESIKYAVKEHFGITNEEIANKLSDPTYTNDVAKLFSDRGLLIE